MRKITAALALSGALTAEAGTYTDLWFNPQESGWGINVVQQLETAFVTMFTYGADGKPTWYYASDARVSAYDGNGLPHFTGALYRAEGPYHGGAFDPAKFRPVAVGTLALEVLDKSRMRVHYEAEGVRAVREVRRQTWQQPLQFGHYVAQFVLRVAPRGGQPIATREFAGAALVDLLGTEGVLRVDGQDGSRCEYRGPHVQSGRLLRFSGTFTCSAGEAREGTFELRDVEVSDNGITGYLSTWSSSVIQYGRLAAVRR